MTDVKLFGLKNNIDTNLVPCEPWNFVPKVPASIGTDKAKYVQWRASSRADHLIFTASEGVNKSQRCSVLNPLRRLHGLIADYDQAVDDSFCEGALSRAVENFPPAWISRSFSDGARLLWLFEKPLLLEQDLLAKEFLNVAYRELKVGGFFPNPDVNAWADLTKLYDVGSRWEKLTEHRIDANAIQSWMFEASKKTQWSKLGEIKIPMSVLADEIETRGWNWPGEFEVEARGPVFWDNGDNPTSTIVTEAGMICFSRDKVFYSWLEIFGAGFVKKYQADKIGQATLDIWFDGKQYFRKIDGFFMPVAKDDFGKWLAVSRKLEVVPKRNDRSEVHQAEMFIQNTQRVYGVKPRIFDPHDTFMQDGLRYLNCSNVRAQEPALGRMEWGENFPWIAGFLDAKIYGNEKPYLIGWLQRFYASALAGDPEKGHALFLVGQVKQGKTLLSNKIIGGLLGGIADASSFVTKGSEFNKELNEKGVWVIDDGEVAADAATHRKFSEVVKKLVANPVMNYRAMFRDAQTTIWNGRLVVTLNDDEHSLGMIPDLAASMEEKVIVLKFKDDPFEFPVRTVLESTILAELPYLGRYVLDYVLPPEIVGDARLGIKEYINEEVRIKALNAGGFADIIEIVDLWEKRCDPSARCPHGYWQGSVSAWMAECSTDDALRHLISKFTVRQLGRKFIEASRIRDSRIAIVPRDGARKGGNEYRIYLNGARTKNSEHPVKVSFPADI
jgi:hypothetical protein